ncbi:MAG TPA: carbon-nitrogen hydrolase family protein [Acidisoma sp.]|uniref:carbon-nitrogen hydrolase family protein n=1 Tax=Acidisoma sp. TaxID=1872115 RepID=UPI002C9A9997|nr:carbon-nitrogen hydrolase family protein [Acidisoma sp.]HTI00482.1 carbon-nitrogen hydrolase family protein [Acidisoma sp.]
MTRLRLALAQYPIERLVSLEDFEVKVDAIVRSAKDEGADLLVLPEYAAMELAAAFTDAGNAVSERDAIVIRAEGIVEIMRQAAMRHRLWLLGSSIPMLRDGLVRNRAPFISADGVVQFQEKRVMTRFENEEWQVAAGNEPRVFETPWGRIGISICYDVEFPMLTRAQVEAGAWLILAPSCTDTLWGFHRVHLSARARAIENQCFVAITPTVGEAPWLATLDVNRGYAGVFGPCDRGFPEDGVITRGQLDAPGLVCAELDPALIEAVRENGGVRNHRDWPAAPGTCAVVTF